jgi:hypothetical protein
MDSSLNKLIEAFPTNPVASGKFLQRLLLDDPRQFFIDALPLLRTAPDTPGFYYILALLHSQNLILKNLCDPALFNKPESIALAKRMSRVEPLFDMRLAKMLLATEAKPAGSEAERATQSLAGLRLLEIMAETSDRGRSLLLAQLLHHPNLQVRSKVALLVGKSNKDVKWVSQQMSGDDSRVRANALEALWGIESDDCRKVFLDALDDPANRVVGNGIRGLYMLGLPSAVGSILSMIAHAEDGFRKTGMWLMGEIGDLRFLPVLARLMKESSAALRPYVFRAFAKLKQKRLRLAALPPLRLYALPGKRVPKGWCEVQVIALSASGQPLTSLKATQLALWEKNDLILDYDVRPVMEKEPLSIAFAVPRKTEAAGMPGPFERALDSCLQLKRKVDGWMMLQYCSSEEGLEQGSLAQEESAAELRFLPDTGAAEKSFKTPKSRLSSSRSLLHALLSLMPAMSRGRGRRHLIFLDDGSCRHPDPAATQKIVAAAKKAEITIHGVSPRQTSWRDICVDTGGQWLLGANDESVPELLTGLYAYLVASYQVRYRSDEFHDLRIEVCTDQGLGEVTLPTIDLGVRSALVPELGLKSEP